MPTSNDPLKLPDDMKIECQYDLLMGINELKPHPKNRNQHSEEQIKRLAKILKYQGWRSPVKVSRLSGFIVSGHGRLQAAVLNQWDKVPVEYQVFETEDQENAHVISDNAIARWAELDLSGINSDLGALGPDFDLDLLGIKDFILEPADKTPGCDEDAIPEHVEPKTKLGDLYRLGNHRLLCGDSTQIDAVERLMAGEKADMVFTDPPYRFVSGGKTSKYFDGWEENSFKDDKNETLFETPDFSEWIPLLNGATSENAEIFVMSNDRNLNEIINNLIKNKLKHHNILIWVKNNKVRNKFYFKQFESIAYFFKGRSIEKSITASNVIHLNSEKENIHISQKPVELMEFIFNNHPGQIVFDLFGGSGSTLIACEKTNRKCFMMEIDPHYVDIIVARWEKFSGQKAELLDGTSSH